MMEAAEGGMLEVQLGQMAQQKGIQPGSQGFWPPSGAGSHQSERSAEDDRSAAPGFSADRYGREAQGGDHEAEGLSGAEFDRVFGQMMVKDHREDIKKFEKESNNGMDSDLKNFASSNLPTLKNTCRWRSRSRLYSFA